MKYINAYIKAANTLYMQGNTTEHSFRGALETLLKSMTGFAVVNEARHIACGAPDLTLLKNNIPVGYVEAKDIGKNLNAKDYKNQFDRYKKALDNLIITDYLTFQLFEGEKSIAEVSIGKILSDKIEPVPENFNAFIEMIQLFLQYGRKTIKDSKTLAEFMAAKTRLLAEAIETTIAKSDEYNTLRQQLKGFRETLLSSMHETQFADIYAQTIAYGMFVARLQDNSNDNFTRQRAEVLIPKSNPFLRNLFHYIAYDLDESIRWLVDSLAHMFNYVDIDAIHREFISKDKDPFLHFYEDFLTRYDKNLKNARGAYYTPLAVVRFIARAVDDILKNDFCIADGLADNTKITVENNKTVAEYHRVQILDPAAGTGTFLAEVARNIYRKFENNAGMWNDYARNHLIPRLNGFEIMMAPYTMAHLKIETILQEFGYSANNNDRLQIYLTDSLENPKQNVRQIPFAQWLSNEAAEAAKIKNNAPVMVILGNPPYSGESKNKGEWILRLMEDYKKEPAGGRLQEKNPKWLNDDYVKFIRFGQYFIEKNGEGILAYINNHSFLDNPTFRGMRYHLLQTFDEIYILNLHGNAKKQEKSPDGSIDENVFDIQQGVSINIFIKTDKKPKDESAKVFYFDLFGKRENKYEFLAQNSFKSVAFNEIVPKEPNYFFVPFNDVNEEEYKKGFLITDLFPVNSIGIVTANDKELISYSKFNTDNNLPISYRPFDNRYIDYDMKKVERPRYNVMQHFIDKENIGLIAKRQCKQEFSYVFITNKITESCLFESAYANISLFPLYTYDMNQKEPNLNSEIVKKFEKEVGLKFVEENSENEESFAPIDLLDYIYAVLHSPSYRQKYKEFLKIDFPRIPYPKNAEQFEKFAAFGERLRHLHLMENITVLDNFANFPISGDNKVENSFTPKSNDYRESKVWINAAQYFDNVPEIAWNFYIGGYQPAQKWLKDRKNRVLTYEEIVHYQKIVTALDQTAKIMIEIDKTIVL